MAVKRTLRGVSIFPSPEAMKKLSETRFIQWYLPFTRSSIPAVGILKQKKKTDRQDEKNWKLDSICFWFFRKGIQVRIFWLIYIFFASFRFVSSCFFRSLPFRFASCLAVSGRFVSCVSFHSVSCRFPSFLIISYHFFILFLFLYHPVQPSST